MVISSKLVIRREVRSALSVVLCAARLSGDAGYDDERRWGGDDFGVSLCLFFLHSATGAAIYWSSCNANNCE
jgi:hypothetical protein